MNLRRFTHALPYVAVVAIAAAIGALTMNLTQRHVTVVPGEAGCVRLDGSARQSACLTKLVSRRVAAATKGVPEAARDERVARVVGDLDDAVADEQLVGANCHQAMHGVGRSEGARAARRDSVPVFPRGGVRLCTAGYVHGLAEGYMAVTPNPDVASVFPVLCRDDAAASGCAHGMGHAVLRAKEWGAARSVSASVAACGDLPAGHVADCTNGVYMELAMHRPSISLERYVGACADQATPQLRASCFSYVPTNAAINDVATARVPAICQAQPGAAGRLCMEAYGRDLGVTGMGRCDRITNFQLADRCVLGAVQLQVSSGHVSTAVATRACNELRAALARSCADHVAATATPAK